MRLLVEIVTLRLAVWFLLAWSASALVAPTKWGWRLLVHAATASGVDRDAVRSMSVKELRSALGERGLPWGSYIEKEELVGALVEVLTAERDFCLSGNVRPGVVAELSAAELEVEIADDSTPLVVEWFARWCGPCQLMVPELTQAARRLGTRARVAKIDSDLAPDLASAMSVGGLPTVVLFDRGREVRRVEGAVMADALVGLVDAARPE